MLEAVTLCNKPLTSAVGFVCCEVLTNLVDVGAPA
jgi:hypothetical protein